MKALISVALLALVVSACSKERPYPENDNNNPPFQSREIIIVERDTETGEVRYTRVVDFNGNDYESLVMNQALNYQPVPTGSRIKSRFPDDLREGLYFIEDGRQMDREDMNSYFYNWNYSMAYWYQPVWYYNYNYFYYTPVYYFPYSNYYYYVYICN